MKHRNGGKGEGQICSTRVDTTRIGRVIIPQISPRIVNSADVDSAVLCGLMKGRNSLKRIKETSDRTKIHSWRVYAEDVYSLIKILEISLAVRISASNPEPGSKVTTKPSMQPCD